MPFRFWEIRNKTKSKQLSLTVKDYLKKGPFFSDDNETKEQG